LSCGDSALESSSCSCLLWAVNKATSVKPQWSTLLGRIRVKFMTISAPFLAQHFRMTFPQEGEEDLLNLSWRLGKSRQLLITVSLNRNKFDIAMEKPLLGDSHLPGLLFGLIRSSKGSNSKKWDSEVGSSQVWIALMLGFTVFK
jgi:hypothetical protein